MTDADRGCLSRGAKGKERDLAPIDKIRSPPRAALLRPGPAEADSLAVFGFPVAAGLPLLSSSSSPAQPHGANSNRRSQTGLEWNEELAQGLPLLAFVCTAKMAQVISNSGHDDMIHDAGLDYYGRRLATCSSDKTIKIFEIEGDTHRLVETLKGHEGAVWCVAWAHPKFGTILASSSYDGKVLIWREQPVSTTSPAGGSSWSKVFDFSLHTASVNMVSWAPHESGCLLACASSDGHVSVIEFRDNSWTHQIFHAHGMGVNAVSWAPAASPGSLISANPGPGQQRRFVTGGSDNAVKIWEYNPETKSYTLTQTLEGHTDWVRDVAWSPSILSKSYIASASQDKTVRIWTSDASNPGQWTSQVLEFDTVLWRVSWSLSGNILAVSGGDNKVSLWKENLKGQWEKVKDIEE